MKTLRFLAKSLIHGAIDWSGRPYRRRRQLRGKLIILTYHSFCTTWPRGLFSSLPVDRFERQLRFLKRNFTLVSLDQGLDYLARRHGDDRPWVAVTIDDGFRDNHSHAWPVLRRYDVPATIFVATDFIDTGRPPWPTQLVEILERTPKRAMEMPFHAPLEDLGARARAARRLKEYLAPLAPARRFEHLAALRHHLEVGDDTRYPPLTWDQIRQMHAAGVHFGSHTTFHSILPAVDAAVMTQELAESKRRIEEQLQTPCLRFAYPDGKHNALSLAALESCGYRMAVTQDYGVNHDAGARLALKRIEVPFHDPMPSFRGRVSDALTLRAPHAANDVP